MGCSDKREWSWFGELRLFTLQEQQEHQPVSQDSSVLHKVQKYTKEIAPVPESMPSAQLIFKYGRHAQPAAVMGCGYWRSLPPSLIHSLALNILLCYSLPLSPQLQIGALPFNTVDYFQGTRCHNGTTEHVMGIREG